MSIAIVTLMHTSLSTYLFVHPHQTLVFVVTCLGFCFLVIFAIQLGLLYLFFSFIKAIYACGEILEMKTNLTVIRLNFFAGILMLLAYTINCGGKQILILIGLENKNNTDKYRNWTNILETVSVIGFFVSFLILIYVFRGYVAEDPNPNITQDEAADTSQTHSETFVSD